MTSDEILAELHRQRRDAEQRRNQLGNGGESLAHYFDGVLHGIQLSINAVSWVRRAERIKEKASCN